ncbi:thermonuclease family protein [Pseudonocardia sp. NPDC049635]|uniref:thermonuclease family protein n=1 Tax=Pseudonocardia sp. NPDC049635 TaxID=3155506 RepID=UPI003401F90C
MTRAMIWPAAALLALLMIGGCGLADAAPQLPAPFTPVPTTGVDMTTTATVTRVVDGDTVKLDDGRTVRVLGIDTPETVHPSKPVECWGPEATAFAEALLLGKQVRVATDSSQDTTDRYDRTLAELLLPDGTNYSVAAAGAGTARAYIYDTPPRVYPEVKAAELVAQARGHGMWGSCPR